GRVRLRRARQRARRYALPARRYSRRRGDRPPDSRALPGRRHPDCTAGARAHIPAWRARHPAGLGVTSTSPRMSTIDDDSGEEARSFGERVSAAANATASLARTRLAIFKAELSVKAALAAKGFGAAAAAAAFVVAMIMMLGALVVALFAALFHSLILGIL